MLYNKKAYGGPQQYIQHLIGSAENRSKISIPFERKQFVLMISTRESGSYLLITHWIGTNLASLYATRGFFYHLTEIFIRCTCTCIVSITKKIQSLNFLTNNPSRWTAEFGSRICFSRHARRLRNSSDIAIPLECNANSQ